MHSDKIFLLKISSLGGFSRNLFFLTTQNIQIIKSATKINEVSQRSNVDNWR